MIHVCFGLYDKTGRYSKFTGTTMLSIFENTNSKVTVHILHDNTLSTDNRDKFIYLVGQYNQRVKFYNVEELCAKEISQLYQDLPSISTNRHTIATMYRFFIPKLIPTEIKKIIYLDSDIIVNLDINELWREELNEKIFAGVPEILNHATDSNMKNIHRTCRDGLVKTDDYFNAGVLLINLNVFRNEKETLSEGTKFIGKNPQYIFLDQDILNYCFSTRTIKLPIKFNCFVEESRLKGNFILDSKMYHYVSRNLKLDMSDPFNCLWMSYFIKTPWFDEDSIGRLYAGFQQLHVSLKQSMVNLSSIMSGKTRAFFALPNNVDGFKKFFSIREDEEIILAENQDSLRKLLDAMNASRGKKVFFIMLPNFPFQILTQAGFVYGKDFINGFEFFSEAQGIPLNSYPLIQAM